MARRLIEACTATGMTHEGIMFVDGHDAAYDFALPQNWRREGRAENVGIGAAMDWFLGTFPDLPFYGWLADDFVPKTPGWDVALAAAAADRYIAYCDDEWPRPEAQPNWITSAFAVGGGLVRGVGWFAAPGLRQAGIDSAWNFLGRRFGLMRYLADVRVEHVHWKNGKRSRDGTDNQPETEQVMWRAFIDGPAYSKAAADIEKFLACSARQAG